MLKTAFVGAGGRAQSAHYPSVDRLDDARIEAVSELDESRMGEVVDRYGIPQAFGDYREMIDAVAPTSSTSSWARSTWRPSPSTA